MRSSAPPLLAVLLVTFSAALSAADEDRKTWPDKPAQAEELTGASPAHLIPRMELRHQYVEPDSGGGIHITSTRMDVLFLRRLLLRYELPLVNVDAAGAQHSGLGDIQVKAFTLLTQNPRHITVAITGITIDTASKPMLGEGKQIADIGFAGALKVQPWLLLFASIEEQVSFAGEDARSDVNRLFANVGAVVFGGQGDWYTLDLIPQIDFSDDNHARLLAVVETGRMLQGRVGLFLRFGTQLLGEREMDYTLAAGLRYLFRLGP